MPSDPSTSAFNPAAQHQNVDAKIVASLERLSQTFRSLLWDEATESGLSPIQVQLLIHLRFHPTGSHRVSSLAEQFDLTNATVSEALSTLVDKGLLTKERDPADGRARVLALTQQGAKAADRLAGWATAMQRQLAAQSDAEKVLVMRFLMNLIADLQKAGSITVARMCSTCRFFEAEGRSSSVAPHYCALLDTPLAVQDLRFDCPEHQTLEAA